MSRKQSIPKSKGNTADTEAKLNIDEKIIINDVELKTIEVRLNSVKDATQRSRFIFIVMTIISSAMLLAIWNITLSWDKEKAFLDKSEESKIVDDGIGNLTINEKRRILSNQNEVISEWIKNRVISISPLGIRINATDLSVIGSLSLTIITVWFFFSVRRENRAIVTLLRDVYKDWINKEVSLDVCRMVYYGIVNNLIFIDMRGGDKPISGLNKTGSEKTALQEYQKGNPETVTTETVETEIKNKKIRTSSIRKLISVLVFLPPITIFLIITSDVASLLIRSPFRLSKANFFTYIMEHSGSFETMCWIIGFDSVALAGCIYTAFICRRCSQFSKGNADTIIEFRKATKVE